MNLSLYLDKGTIFHTLHPLVKMLILAIYFTLTMLFINPFYLLGLTAIIFVHLAISKSWENINRVKNVLIMIAIGTIIIWSFFQQGETKLIGPIEVESVIFGIGMTLRLQLMIIAGLIFLSTTKNEEIAIVMTMLGASYSFAFAVSAAIRLVPSIVGTGETIIQAQKSRGLNVEEGNIFTKIRKQLPLLIPIFLSTIRSNNQLAMALESKGFGVSSKRTNYLEPKITSKDYAILAGFIIILAVAIYLKVEGYGQSVNLI